MPAKQKAAKTTTRSGTQRSSPNTLTLRQRITAFMKRRPHRSFRLTHRRDYKRSLKLPGYMAFAGEVWSTLRAHGKVFLVLVGIYALFGIILGTMGSQTMYNQISELMRTGGEEMIEGDFTSIVQAGLLSIAALGGAQGLSEVQQVYASLLFLLIWLTTVWLLREFLAGGKPRLRDGLYNASAPLVSTFLVFAVLLIQLVPIGILAVVYNALLGIDMLSSGLGAFLFSMVTLLVVTLTLYWVTTTFIALIVVTLPGMYPWQALRTASDLVIGRRLRILYRLLYLGGMIVLAWLLIMVPMIALDGWLRSIWGWYEAVPFVPFIAVILSALSTVWAAGYVYLLYRKVIDDDSSPA